MENELNDEIIIKPVEKENQKKEIILPIISFLLSSSIIVLFFGSLLLGYVMLFMVLLPIAGLVTGIESLRRGKKRIGVAGMILSIIAVAIPAAIVFFIIVLFVGASTGLIYLM
ncbi:MAG: hypothetical protein LBC71_01660 [Oscillospiraceae bacterium]|jgi:hypothetical protein|nr:hypothetical protein [Oscillospiraceae bacterium]